MRYSGRWMTIVDERILEYLSENEFTSPGQVTEAAKIRYSTQYVGQRCHELCDRRLLEHVGNSVYRITEDGQRYLDGDLDTGEMDMVDEEERASA